MFASYYKALLLGQPLLGMLDAGVYGLGPLVSPGQQAWFRYQIEPLHLRTVSAH
ncbi:hypothetical protein Ancab_005490 [Ancistrocladus abbreviatus]